MVDGCQNKLVNMVYRAPQGSVLRLQLFLLYTAELFSIVENNLYNYADNSTLVGSYCAIPILCSNGIPEWWSDQVRGVTNLE